MAYINISVNTTTDLFTIILDNYEWQSLYVNTGPNGAYVAVPPYNNPNHPNIQFLFTQSTSGPLMFKAIADHNITITQPFYNLLLAGPNQNHSYLAQLHSFIVNSEVHLHGSLDTEPYAAGSVPSPIKFNEGKMKGVFEVNNNPIP